MGVRNYTEKTGNTCVYTRRHNYVSGVFPTRKDDGTSVARIHSSARPTGVPGLVKEWTVPVKVSSHVYDVWGRPGLRRRSEGEPGGAERTTRVRRYHLHINVRHSFSFPVHSGALSESFSGSSSSSLGVSRTGPVLLRYRDLCPESGSVGRGSVDGTTS